MQSPPAILPAESVLLEGDRVVTDSRMVAKAFRKAHADVLRSIDRLDCSEGFAKRNFAFCFEINELQNGKPNRFCRMTKDGFMFLVMGFRGSKAAAVKEAFIDAFNAMADFIAHQIRGAWETYNEAQLRYRSKKRHISSCGRDMRYWRDDKPVLLAELERLHPQIPLHLPLHGE